MADKNVYITPTSAEGNTYYFNGCHVWGHFDKHLNDLPIPKGMISMDLLFSARTVRVTGIWKDDDVKNEYDGLTAFYRLLHFVYENEEKSVIYQFHWSNDGFEEPDLYVKVLSIDYDREPGTKGMITYNIVFKRITESV